MVHPAWSEQAAAWELRTAWALQREVIVVLSRGDALRGYVRHVAPTGAFVMLWDGRDDRHVPCAIVGGVLKAHMHHDGQPVAPPIRETVVLPLDGQLELPLTD